MTVDSLCVSNRTTFESLCGFLYYFSYQIKQLKCHVSLANVICYGSTYSMGVHKYNLVPGHMREDLDLNYEPMEKNK